MFERNRVDNAEQPGLGVTVEIVTDHGETLTGRLIVSSGRALSDTLNSAGGFIEFEPWGGERSFYAKASLRSIKVVQQAKAESLKGRVASLDGFDPFATLGVSQKAPLDEVKSAWHRLSKVYHPDRYAAAELPSEVVDYLSAMARRVNAAYAALEKSLAAERRAESLRSAPIYQSFGRT